MVFRFFKRKESSKQLPPPNLEQSVDLTLSTEQQLPTTLSPLLYAHASADKQCS